MNESLVSLLVSFVRFMIQVSESVMINLILTIGMPPCVNVRVKSRGKFVRSNFIRSFISNLA